MTRQLTAYLETLGYKIVEMADRPDKAAWGTPAEVYELAAVFTTRDGSWDPISNPQMDDANIGKLEQWAFDKYGHIRVPSDPYYYAGCGGATHLHMLVLGQDGKPMIGKGHLYWDANVTGLPVNSNMVQRTGEAPHGWSNCYIEHGSGYTPPNSGVWSFCPFGLSTILEKTGLYKSFHLATFAVWQAKKPGTDDGGGDDNDDGGNDDGDVPETGTLRELIDRAVASNASALKDLLAIRAMIG